MTTAAGESTDPCRRLDISRAATTVSTRRASRRAKTGADQGQLLAVERGQEARIQPPALGNPGYGVSAKSYEPEHGHAEGDHGEVVGRPLLVAGRDAAILLEPTNQPLDLVALTIRGPVEVGLTRLVLAGRNDRLDPALPQATTG
jgi:hypothetical protein